MSTVAPTSLADLVHAGETAFRTGDTFTARSLFRSAVEQDPSHAQAWLGLSRVTPVLRERHSYLQKALALAPDLADAHADLLDVEHLLAQGMQILVRLAAAPSAPPAPIASSSATIAEPERIVCGKHPERETGLRCVSCMQPICGKCARPSPVGHLCQTCLRGRRPVNYQVQPKHVIIGVLIAAVLSFVMSALISMVMLGFYGFYIALAVSPFAGAAIVAVIDRLTRGKRGRSMQIAVGSATAFGMLPVVFLGPLVLALLQMAFANPEAIAMMQDEGVSLGALVVSGINPGLICFAVLTIISAMYRLR